MLWTLTGTCWGSKRWRELIVVIIIVYQLLYYVSTFVSHINFCIAHQFLHHISTSVSHIKFCIAYQLLYHVSTSVLHINFCIAYQLLYQISTSVLHINFCIAYLLLYHISTSVSCYLMHKASTNGAPKESWCSTMHSNGILLMLSAQPLISAEETLFYETQHSSIIDCFASEIWSLRFQ